jgi:hypothetical protein
LVPHKTVPDQAIESPSSEYTPQLPQGFDGLCFVLAIAILSCFPRLIPFQ